MKKEELFLLKILNNVTPFNDNFFYKKDHEVVLEYDIKNNILYISWRNLWFNLEYDYHLTDKEITSLFKRMLKQYLNYENFYIKFTNNRWDRIYTTEFL
jgi:hypothetical protein